MTRKTVLMVILGLWAVAFIGSMLAYQLTEPTGDSFTRGLNRVTTFLGWQFVATLLAIASWVIGRKFPRGSRLRRAGYVPAIGLNLLVITLALIAVFFWAQYDPPNPLDTPELVPTAPMPTTG